MMSIWTKKYSQHKFYYESFQFCLCILITFMVVVLWGVGGSESHSVLAFSALDIEDISFIV